MIAIASLLAMPLYQAMMIAKPLNLVGNLSALIWFFMGGYVNIPLTILMGIGSVAGGWTGAHFVTAKNNCYIRYLITVVLCVSVLSSLYEVYTARH